MASKTQKRRKRRLQRNTTIVSQRPLQVSLPPHEKSTRKNVRHKQKIRMGHCCSYDIYAELEARTSAGKNQCTQCGAECRVRDFCVSCATGEGNLHAQRRRYVDNKDNTHCTQSSTEKKSTSTAHNHSKVSTKKKRLLERNANFQAQFS